MLNLRIQRYVKSKMRKRRVLFHATDFQSLMYPCFTFCRILGTFPFKINGSTFEASKPHYILSTVIICVYCVFYLALIYNIIMSKFNFGIIRNLEATCYYTIISFMVIITHTLSSPLMRLLQTILEISSKLSSESYKKMSKLIHIKDVSGIIFLLVISCIYFSKLRVFGYFVFDYFTVLTIVFTMYAALLIFQINMLYVNCVCILKACFKNINDDLVHMQRLVANDIKSYVPRMICHMQRNQFLLIELKNLKKRHHMISDAVQLLNIIFSLHLLAFIVISFINITFELYFYVVHWQDGLLISFDMQFLVALLTSIGYYVIFVTLIVWVCETNKNQAREIGTTIHDLLNSTSDEQIKNEVRLFSLQILHRKSIFSAKGLTVDATLLATIVGNITTYLLILMQFLNMSHSCDGKITTNVTQSN